MKAKHIEIILIGALLSGSALAAEPAVVAPPATAPAQAASAGVAQVSPESLLALQAAHDPALLVLDVRTPEEFAKGHVPGAVNIPHDQIAARLAEVPKDQEIVLYCGSGRRAGLAADVLTANGYTRLAHLQGDMNGWVAQGRPVETASPPPARAQP